MKNTIRVSLGVFAAVILFGCGWLAAPAASSPAQTTAAAPTATLQAPQAAGSPALSADQNLEDLYRRVGVSVVQITVILRNTGTSFLGTGSAPSVASGSGFVWDTQGNIVTNNHVVENAESLTVTFPDGTQADAKIIGTDPGSDLAVIRVAVDPALLVPVTLGDSSAVQVGQSAAVIGYPFGLDSTMTSGIVSGLSRLLPVSASDGSGLSYSIPDVIQTDAPINPGNSGGVMVDDRGEVIGVPSANISTSGSSAGVGFAIPSNIVKMVVPVLISSGSYPHAYLGISGGTLTPDLASAMGLEPGTHGVLIASVQSGGAADKAGLIGSSKQVTIKGFSTMVGGDIITAADGNPIADFEDLIRYMFLNKTLGDTMQLTILRGTQTSTVEVAFPSSSGG
jgi:serine protease Do